MNELEIQQIVEATIFASGEPVSISQMLGAFSDNQKPSKEDIKLALSAIDAFYADRGIELKQVASGYRFQARQNTASCLQRLW